MEQKEITKRYSNGELNVLWKPGKCIHAAECVKRLPQVYNPDEKPWIKAENASTAELIAQINACPSGALTYEMQNDVSSSGEKASNAGKAELLANGPLLVHGEVELKMATGEVKMCSGTTAFCRCGASSNKPYCDGSHGKIGFQG